MTSDDLIAEVGRRIAKPAPGRRSSSSGSHARGDANEYSDLDVLVIEPDVANAAAESVRLRDVLGGLPSAIDGIVVSQIHADEWRDVRGSLVHAALSEGRVIAA